MYLCILSVCLNVYCVRLSQVSVCYLLSLMLIVSDCCVLVCAICLSTISCVRFLCICVCYSFVLICPAVVGLCVLFVCLNMSSCRMFVCVIRLY